jgi:hypothetical protein
MIEVGRLGCAASFICLAARDGSVGGKHEMPLHRHYDMKSGSKTSLLTNLDAYLSEPNEDDLRSIRLGFLQWLG